MLFHAFPTSHVSHTRCYFVTFGTSVAIDYMQYFLEGSAATSTVTAPTSDVSGHHKKKQNKTTVGITFRHNLVLLMFIVLLHNSKNQGPCEAEVSDLPRT